MAVALTVVDQHADNKGRITTIATVVFTGSYPAGGEVFDWDAIVPGGQQPIWVELQGNAGYSYEYEYATMKIMVKQAGAVISLPEAPIPTATYPAAVLADVVRALAITKVV